MNYDPYPTRLLLGPKEIQSLLGMGRSEWYEFLADPTTGFPAPVVLGKTSNGHDRRRWKKLEVYFWIESRPKATAPDELARPKVSETVRNRPKPSGAVADE